MDVACYPRYGRLPKRYYNEFLASDEGISTNILAERMKSLVENRFVTRTPDPKNRSRTIYLPTEKTLALKPMVEAMIEWSLTYGPSGLQ